MGGDVMLIYATMVLKRKIDSVIARPEYQPGVPRWDGTPATWCNEAANAVLVELGYNTKPILNPKGIKWTNALSIYTNAIAVAASGGADVHEVSPRQAQARANIGIPILAVAKNPNPKQSSHVGIVYPTNDEWNPKAGPLIGQAGAKQTHGVRSAYDSFTKWGLSTPRYFQLPLAI
jgi:hypothetical protein